MREAAGRWRLNLVVAPSRGGSGIRRLFAGTLVERLVRSIDVPVLVTRQRVGAEKEGEAGVHRIAAGVRLAGDPEDGLLQCASRIAGDFQAWLHVIHILESPPDMLECGSYESNQRLAMESLGQDLMHAARENRVDPALVISTVLTGTPGEAFTRYIREAGIDLAVVGVRRIGKFRKNVIGSTTEYLLRYSPGMVLTVPVDAMGEIP
jgi:nucleotide-binding universal stress UspA family protein